MPGLTFQLGANGYWLRDALEVEFAHSLGLPKPQRGSTPMTILRCLRASHTSHYWPGARHTSNRELRTS